MKFITFRGVSLNPELVVAIQDRKTPTSVASVVVLMGGSEFRVRATPQDVAKALNIELVDSGIGQKKKGVKRVVKPSERLPAVQV